MAGAGRQWRPLSNLGSFARSASLVCVKKADWAPICFCTFRAKSEVQDHFLTILGPELKTLGETFYIGASLFRIT